MIPKYQIKILLVLIVLVAFWPISSGQYSMANDMLDCWLPWRTFIAEHIKQGEIPIWNPYQACGYPIYADLQGPLWSPESIVSSLLFENTLNAISFLYLFYLSIAAIGMFDVVWYFTQKKTNAFLTAAAFVLSGFFYSHAQHFYAIISAAWFPYLFLSIYKFLFDQKFNSGLKAILILFLCSTTGNPTFTIISLYIFFVLLIYKLWQIRKEWTVIKKLSGQIMVLAGIALLMHSVLIVSAAQSFDLISRNKGLSLDRASYNSFTLESCISYIFPVTSNIPTDFFKTDLTMRDFHFGFLFFIALIVLLVKKNKSHTDTLFLGIALLCWILSFGKDFYLYTLFFNTLPGLNLFRFPSYYHFFTLFFILLYIGLHFHELLEELSRKKAIRLFSGIIVLLSGVSIAIYIVTKESFKIDIQEPNSFYTYITHLSFARSTYINIGIIITSLAVGLVLIGINKMQIIRVFAITFVIELVGTVCICQWQTALSECKRATMVDGLKHIQQTKEHDYRISSIHDNASGINCLWRNTNTYKHQISADYFNSFELDTFVQTQVQQDSLFKQMINHQLIYTEDSIKNKITHITFENNSVKALVDIDKPTKLFILQNWSRYWNCYIDGKLIKISPHFCFIKANMPHGKHQLVLKFEPPYIYLSFVVSYLTFLLVLIYTMIDKKQTLEN
ncbi:MAG: hypothetical protein HYZ42_16625 [Bacteroidetes bacterium]|nr:hypothetical protein [Bacteroidota bacterium]